MSINHSMLFVTEQNWQLPLALAFVIHIVVLLLLVMPPSFLVRHRDFQEVQSINLFTPAELKPVKRHRKTRPRTRAKPAPPKKAKLSHIIARPQRRPIPTKAVSLRPRQVSKKPAAKLVRQETANEKLLRRAMARIRAKINAEKEAKEIKNDVSNLVKDLHHMPAAVEKAPPAAAPAPVAATADNHLRGQQTQDSSHAAMAKAKRQYYMAISRRIHDNWSLPETQNWSPALEATIVMVVRRDGVVTKTFFEKKSTNIYFDQYVEKTINDSTPMPAFPAAIREQQLEIGLRFRPSGMF